MLLIYHSNTFNTFNTFKNSCDFDLTKEYIIALRNYSKDSHKVRTCWGLNLIQKILVPEIDIKTRWNSTYNMELVLDLPVADDLIVIVYKYAFYGNSYLL